MQRMRDSFTVMREPDVRSVYIQLYILLLWYNHGRITH